jgi:hypothetical protein
MPKIKVAYLHKILVINSYHNEIIKLNKYV